VTRISHRSRVRDAAISATWITVYQLLSIYLPTKSRHFFSRDECFLSRGAQARPASVMKCRIPPRYWKCPPESEADAESGVVKSERRSHSFDLRFPIGIITVSFLFIHGFALFIIVNPRVMRYRAVFPAIERKSHHIAADRPSLAHVVLHDASSLTSQGQGRKIPVRVLTYGARRKKNKRLSAGSWLFYGTGEGA